MGAIRGILLVIASVLLFFCLIQLTLYGTLSQSLTYENVEKHSTVLINDILKGSTNFTNKINSIYPVIQLYCKNNSNYVFSFEDRTFEVSCEKVLLGKEAIVEEGLKNWVKDIYYKDYGCKFLECIKNMQIPLFLISEQAQMFWAVAFRILLMISIILALAVFLFAKKTNAPIIIGVLLILSSLPFIKLDSLLALFAEKTFFQFLSIFFSQSFFVSVRVLIVGVIFLIVGIILKIFKIGFFISKLILKTKDFITKVREEEKPKQKSKMGPFKKSDLFNKKSEIVGKNVKKGKKK